MGKAGIGSLGVLLGLALLARAEAPPPPAKPPEPFVAVLGIAQDGGYPHAGCRKACCARLWKDPRGRRHVSSLALVDPRTGERWLFDASPDFPAQLQHLNELAAALPATLPREAALADHLGLAGIFLTHAHIGHYTGLMMLGREAIGARGVPVFAMPRMREFLRGNGPWSQLVTLGNIEIRSLEAGNAQTIGRDLTVEPFLVPHRDEFSETVGFLVSGPSRRVLFLPDIDKWERWDRRIEDLLAGVDRAYLDGTFFAEGEIPGRSMAEVPHPFIRESLARFDALPPRERAKIRFIHLNHTNPALDPASPAREAIEHAGMAVAEEGERFDL